MRLNRSFIILAFIIPLVTVASMVIYFEFTKAKSSVFTIIKEHLINQKVFLFQKYVETIQKNYEDNFADFIIKNPYAAKALEDELGLLQGEDVKYLYVLFKDKDGKFRYLLDATKDPDERASCTQKFDTQSDIWEKAYRTKQYQIAEQKSLETLWVTIAYPIVIHKKVVAVLGADFTYDVYMQIVNILNPIEKIFLYITLFMLIMLLLAYILVYLYYKTRKKAFIDPLTHI